jgi:membrane-bound metal-dependent hydrolase YbcI (DUF457 family)
LTGKTHAAAGAFIGAVIGQLTGSPLEGFFLGMFAGLLPDIDHPPGIPRASFDEAEFSAFRHGEYVKNTSTQAYNTGTHS